MEKENLVYGWMVIWIIGLKLSEVISFGTSILMIVLGMLLTLTYTLIGTPKRD